MAIKTVLFDLDGTLLPMDQEIFVNAYFGLLAKRLAPLGYEPQKLIKAIWGGTKVMIANDGTKTNEEAFWEYFCGLYGEKAKDDIVHFDAFYRNEFNLVQGQCGFAPKAAEVIAKVKERGLRAVLATNPIFPEIATLNRIRWAGLNAADFDYITTYERCRWCKPSPEYYTEILERLGLRAEECAMVGNDTGDDLPAAALGMPVFLLTDCLINAKGVDIEAYPHGSFDELIEWIGAL